MGRGGPPPLPLPPPAPPLLGGGRLGEPDSGAGLAFLFLTHTSRMFLPVRAATKVTVMNDPLLIWHDDKVARLSNRVFPLQLRDWCLRGTPSLSSTSNFKSFTVSFVRTFYMDI